MSADEHHLTPDQVAGFLAGALGPAERSEVAGHLDGCVECRHELIAVGGMVADQAAAVVAPPTSRRRRLTAVGMAIAAGIAVIAFVRGRPEETVVRADGTPGMGEGVPAIGIVEPLDGAEVKDSVVLRWRSAGRDSYHVFLLSEDGRPLWSIQTADTVVRVPASVAVEPGAMYFWRADAVGNGIVATTGVHRLTVSR